MSVLTAESAADWQAVASSSFVPLQCTVLRPSFSGRITRFDLGTNLHLASVTSDSTVVTRTEALAARSESDDIHVSLQLGSRGRIVQGDRSAEVAPGSLTIYETNKPYVLDYSHPGQHQLVMQVPRRALRLSDDTITALAARDLGSAPSARVFFAFASQLANEAAALDAPNGISDAAVDLLAATLRSIAQDQVPAISVTEATLTAIRTDVRTRISDPLLTVDDLLQRHFVSRRTLYTLFESVGQSPAEYIREARVEEAKRVLLAAPHLTLAQLAYASGFADEGTLSRAFRRFVGQTPRDWLTTNIGI